VLDASVPSLSDCSADGNPELLLLLESCIAFRTFTFHQGCLVYVLKYTSFDAIVRCKDDLPFVSIAFLI
jgi:hypothetical protein